MRKAIHLIPIFIIFLEYISISGSLKIAQNLSQYSVIEMLGGLIRIGGNVSYHIVPTLLLFVHIGAFVLAVFYFYMVTLHGFGIKGSDEVKNNQVMVWSLDDE